MTIYNLYIFDRHCQCIYFQKWSHKTAPAVTTSSSITGTSTNSQLNNSSRLGTLTATTNSSRFSASSAASSVAENTNSSSLVRSQTVQSGLAAGSVISIEEEANQDGFISYKTSTYRLHYYETPTGLKFVMNSDPNTENLRLVLKQIYIQLYVEFVVKNGLMRFDDTRWEISHGYLPTSENTEHSIQQQQPASSSTTPQPGNISNELFRVAVDRFIRTLKSFE
ncbi:hypothetical protein RMCBS344292_08176 [Rhizopus microsporus]|nr:hypothetical protein RMCBS344292_08176 [Rhizopus microsporus]